MTVLKNKTVKIEKKLMVIMTMTAKKRIMEKSMKLETPPIKTGKTIMVPGLNVKKEGKMIKNDKTITTEIKKEHDQKKRKGEVAGCAILRPNYKRSSNLITGLRMQSSHLYTQLMEKL